MGCKRLTLLEKTLKSWRTLKKASLNRGFSLKKLDLVKVFLLTKNFTKSGLYCISFLSLTANLSKMPNIFVSNNYFLQFLPCYTQMRIFFKTTAIRICKNGHYSNLLSE